MIRMANSAEHRSECDRAPVLPMAKPPLFADPSPIDLRAGGPAARIAPHVPELLVSSQMLALAAILRALEGDRKGRLACVPRRPGTGIEDWRSAIKDVLAGQKCVTQSNEFQDYPPDFPHFGMSWCALRAR